MICGKGVVLWEKVEMMGIVWVSWVFGGILMQFAGCGSLHLQIQVSTSPRTEHGAIFSCPRMHEAANFQSNLDGKPQGND